MWGKYRAVVTDVNDPEKRGRIKTKLVVDKDMPELAWNEPCFVPGTFLLPAKGDTVWIEFEEGDVDFPIWVGILPKATQVSSIVGTPYDPKKKVIKADELVAAKKLDTKDLNVTGMTKTGNIQAGNISATNVSAPNL